MAAINLDIGGNTRRLDRDIQKTVNRVYAINLKTKGDQPLGRITGKVNEFNKSLDASNARVIAFGASAGIIFGVQRAFSALVGATIEVQKSLQDINVILNVSAQNLQKFGGELFSIAKNTGQSFQDVAKAATEFSRQGLGVEETLKRTSEALILSRLSGLDAAKSVEALTAAVNSYASQAVTATEVVNKFANVDAAFAVSSADLAEALQRVGSSAAQSGVSLNELIAIVTSAQQTTARGGAVIGNSFKTIFTRLQRGKVVDLLGTLGISDTNAGGQLKSTIQLLQDLGKVYDTLGSRQQAYVAEQVGGVFQINILKAALADLGKEYSIYSSALNVAAGSTDQAIRRNEELNKTYAAQLNALRENARQLASAAGERLVGPSIDRLVGGTNNLLEGLGEGDGKGIGTVLGKGILDGLGQFIAGPGIALIGGVLLKLFRDLGKFATGSVQQLLGLNTAATQQRDLQASISSILAKNPDLLNLALKGEQGINTAANTLLASLRNQTLELQNQEKVAQRIARAFAAQAGVRVSGGVPTVPTGRAGRAAGYIPNFARVTDQQKTGEIMGALDGGYIPGKVFEIGGMVVNGAESVYKYPGVSKPEIRPPDGSKAGEEHRKKLENKLGFVPGEGRAKGFIPNFAGYPYKMKSFAGDVVANPRAEKQFNKFFNKGGFSNVEQDDKINTVGFKLEKIPLTPKLQKLYNEQPGSPAFTNEFESETIKKLGFINSGAPGEKNVKLYGGKSAAVDGYKITNGLAEFLEVKGGSFETLSVANKFGRVLPENLGRFTQSKLGVSYLNMLFKEGVPDKKDTVKLKNTLAVPDVPKSRKGNFNRPFRLSDIEKNRAKNVGKASGFIPNFAKIIDLGDTVTAPQLKGKVSSLIHPKVTGGKEPRTVTANYLGQQYKGSVTTAGINRAEIENDVPDLEKNLGRILVDEANQFGQAIGGQNFLKSPDELPNYGAVKGAVGNAFEGGVTTLLQRNLQKSSQTAGIDFTQSRMTPDMKRLFHGAPGTYEAKYSPDLANEVLGKMLKAANVGGVKQAKSGPGYKATRDLRTTARENLKGQKLRRGPQLNKAIEEEMANIKRRQGMAAGYIPNFASAKAVSRKTENKSNGNSGAQFVKDSPIGSFYKTPGQSSNLDTLIRRDHPEGLNAALQTSFANQRKGKAQGFIPNFAIEDPDIEGSSAGTGIAAIAAQLTGLAFAFAFSGNQFKDSLRDLSSASKAAAESQRKSLADKIRAERVAARGASRLGPNPRQIMQPDGSFGRYTGDTRQQSVMAVGRRFRSERESVRRQSQASGAQRIGAFGSSNALGLAMAAPILGETIKNVVGQETAGNRQTGAVASGLGQIGSFAATGALIAPGAIGVGVGAAIGALLTIPTIVNEFTSELPELTSAARKSSQELTRFSDVSSRILSGFSKVTELSSGGGSPKALLKAQEDLSKTLSELTLEEKNKVSSALKLGTLEEELAKIIEERIQNEKTALKNVALKSIAEKSLLGFNGGGTFETSSEQGQKDAKVIQEVLGQYLKTAGNDPESLKFAQETSQKGTPVLEGLLKNLTRAEAFGGRQGLATQQAAIPDLEKALQSMLPETETKAADISSLIDIADNNVSSAIALIKLLIDSIGKAPAEIQKNIDLFNESVRATDELSKAQKEYALNTENIVSSLSRSISVLNSFINTLERFNNIEKSSQRERAIGQAFTLPKSIAETVLGPDADLTQNLALFEQLANNENERLTTIENSNQQFRESFRSNLDTALGERLGEIENLKGAGSGGPKELKTAEEEIRKAAKLLSSGAIDINGVLKESFVDGLIDPGKLESDLKSAFERAGIGGGESQKILDGIYQSAINQENASLETNQLAREQNRKAATETTNQKILQSLNQSLKAFGGISTFLNPEEGLVKPLNDLISSTSSQLKAQKDFEFGRATGALTSIGTPEQVQNNIGLGQSSLNFIKQLKTISGGAFTPDPNSELVRRATAGLAQSFENTILELKTILRDPKVDGAFKSQIQEAIRAINVLGSTRELAQLQVAQETGSAFQSTLTGTLSRLQDPAIQSLRDSGLNGLADEVARNAQFTTDPVVNVLETQKSIQMAIAKRLESLEKKIVRAGSTPSASVTGDGPQVDSKAKGFIPAFNKERQAISRGIGGAKASDRPQFIPNLNGGPAFVNSGEQLVDNYRGSRQTAVLTREMQNMAEGSIPDVNIEGDVNEDLFRQLGRRLSGGSVDFNERISKVQNKSIGFIPNFANGQPIITPDSFGPISGEVIQDLTDTGKDYIVIRSNKYLDDSFRNETISFGEGNGLGKIISIDSANPYLARVKPTQAGGVLPPVKGFKFDGKFLDQPKQDLSKEDLDKKIDRYLKLYKEAEGFTITGDSKGTPADAADILKNLQREFKVNSKKYKDIDNDGLYRSVKDSVEALRNKIRSRNSVTEELPQDPEFLNWLEKEKNNKRPKDGIDMSQDSPPRSQDSSPMSKNSTTYEAIKEQVRRYIKSEKPELGEPVSGQSRKATAATQEDLYTDALLRSAQVTAELGKYTGINIGGNNAFGLANEKPKAKIDPQERGGASAGRFMSGQSEFIEFYDKDPKLNTFFNEATHVNQNLLPGNTGVVKELNEAEEFINKNGGPDKYVDRLIKIADFLEQQNKSAQNPFLQILDIEKFVGESGKPFSGAGRRDRRIFGNLDGKTPFIISEAKWREDDSKFIKERASTLMAFLGAGIASGEVTAEELGSLGIPADIAGTIVAETIAIDKQLKEQKPYQPSSTPSTPSTTIPSAPPAVPEIQKAARATPEEVEGERRRKTNERIDKRIEDSKRRLREGEELLNPKASGPSAVPEIQKATRATPDAAEIERRRKTNERIDKRIEDSKRRLRQGEELLNPNMPEAGARGGTAPKPIPKTGNSTPIAPVAKPETPFRIIGGEGNRPATQIDSSGTGVPVPKGGRVNYPGGISPETARAIVQELDSTYNEAIRNSKSPGQSKSWAQTQQRYRLLYSRGQYAELDRFYKSLAKGPGYNNNYGQGTGRRGESVQTLAKGFIPNFAQNYISNLAGLEAGLSGESAAMGYDKKIGAFMYNKPQSKSGNLNEIISKDHPEGLKNAMKNSMKMQKNVGVMSKGYIPNFAVTDQSFAQLESSFNTNTSALTTLAGGIESLNNAIANLSLANLNNIPAQTNAGTQPAAGTQQAANQSSNIGPFNVVVNSSEGDVSVQLTTALDKLKSEILGLVKVKVAPTVPSSQYSPSTFSNG